LVGCDVDAFTRDVHRMTQKGFRLERLGALDLFPQTPHIESLALFSGSALN
jgi:23S rRNA (uracil1939-C5)-methyltransferase